MDSRSKASSQTVVDEGVMEPSENTPIPIAPLARSPEPKRRPLVFISHDHRDADLAEAFANLLQGASGGTIKSFRSSDRRGTTGIEFGSEWYTTVMSRLDEATDVVVLLTQHSMDRPWILYEAGVAKGKLSTPVFGVAIHIPLAQASSGPFAQFQNSDDSEHALTGLVMQLINRNVVDADPSEEAIRLQVRVFREAITNFRGDENPLPDDKADSSTVAKLFEEIKVMVKELPERLMKNVGETVSASQRRGSHGRRLSHSFNYIEWAVHQEPRLFHTAWLVIMAQLKEDVPWVYEVGMKVARAIESGNRARIQKQINDFGTAVSSTDPGFLRDIVQDPATADEVYFVIRQLVDVLNTHYTVRFEPGKLAKLFDD
jgi:hypothetical protein